MTEAAISPRAPGPTAEPQQHHPRVVQSLRERVIRLESMDWRLRVAVLVVGLQAAIVAALIVLQGRSLPMLDVTTVDSHLASMPVPVFWAAVGFSVVAWSYVLAGAIHGTWWLRPLALALFTYAMFALVFITASAGTPMYGLAARGCFIGLWVLAVGTWVHDFWRTRTGAHHLTHRHRLQIPTMVLVVLLVAGVILLPYAAASSANAPLLYREGFFSALYGLADFLSPMLLLTAIDLSEVGLLAIEGATRTAQRLRPPYGVAAAVAVAAGIILYNDLRDVSLKGVLSCLVFGVIVAAGLLAIGFSRRRAMAAAHRIPYSAVAASAVLVFAMPFAVSAYLAPKLADFSGQSSTGVFMTWFSQDKEPDFSIKYPQAWKVTADPPNPDGVQTINFNGTETGTIAEAVVATVKHTSSTTVEFETQDATKLLGSDATYQYQPATKVGQWTVIPFTVTLKGSTNQISGRSYGRFDSGRVWVILAFGADASIKVMAPAFDEMAQSWSAKPHAEAAAGGEGTAGADTQQAKIEREVAKAVGGLGFVSLAFVILCIGGILLAGRRLVPGRALLPAGLLYFGLWAFLEFGARLPYSIRLVGQWVHNSMLANSDFPGMGMYAVRVSMGILSVAALIYWLLRERSNPAWRRALALIAVLDLGLMMLHWLQDGYGAEMNATGKISLLAAFMILAALAWDVVFSGESITNQHGEWFPRHTRVMLFMGYEMLVSTSVLFLSSLHLQFGGAKVEALFEADKYPQMGMYELGLPFVLTLIGLRLVTGSGLDDEASAGAEEPPGAAGADDRALGAEAGDHDLRADPELQPAGA